MGGVKQNDVTDCPFCRFHPCADVTQIPGEHDKATALALWEKSTFINSLTKIIEYLEEDERKHYDGMLGGDREGHIYTHIVNVKRCLNHPSMMEQII